MTDEEYVWMMRRIDALMTEMGDREPSDAEAVVFESLVKQVVEYEKAHFPMLQP
jgi:hypothetical protein